MKTLKNQHLLGILAGLGFVCAVICLFLALSENANSTALAKLNGEVDEAYRKLRSSTEAEFTKLGELRKLDQKQIDELKQENADLKSRARKAESANAANANSVSLLTRKKWLVESSDIEPPWGKNTRDLAARIKKLEDDLADLRKELSKEKAKPASETK